MKWKNRLTNYNFWISIVSAVLLICQALNLEFDIAYINEIVTAVLGLLVVIGIISDPTKTGKDSSSTTTNVVKENNETSTNVVKDNNTTNLVKEDKPIEQAVPTDKENEVVVGNIQDDIQILIDKIKQDLNAGLDLKNSISQDVEITTKEQTEKVETKLEKAEEVFSEQKVDQEQLIINEECANIDLDSNLENIQEVKEEENTEILEENLNQVESDFYQKSETELGVLENGEDIDNPIEQLEEKEETENKIICYNIVN